MPSLWYYRIGPQESGPLDFAELQVLVREARLPDNAEIRDENTNEWRNVQAVPELFLSAANVDDLNSMFAPAEDGESADNGTAVDGCYCRLRDEVLGPMSFEHLTSLTRIGRIAPNDQVRLSLHDEWRVARSIAGLFSESEMAEFAAADAAAEAAATLDSLEVIGDPAPRKPRTRRTEHVPAIPMLDDDGLGDQEVADGRAAVVTNGSQAAQSPPTDNADSADQWHCRVLGQELGPITWSDLLALVETRQLGQGDRVRRSSTGNWVPAGMIDGLFNSASTAESAPVSTSHVAPQRGLATPGTPTPSGIRRTEIGGRFWQPFKRPSPTAESHANPAATAPGKPVARAPAQPTVPEAAKAAAPAAQKSASTTAVAPAIPSSAPVSPSPAPVSPNPAPVSPAPASSQPAATAPATKPAVPPTPAPPRPAPARPVAVALPRPRRQFRNPFRGLGSAIGGGFGRMFGALGSGISGGASGMFSSLGSMGSKGAGSLASAWKPLAGVVVVAGIAAAVYFFVPLSFTSVDKDATIYAATLRIWETAQGMKEKSRADEWRNFTIVSLPQSTSLSNELQAMPEKDPMLDLMLKCHRDCLSKILKGNIRDNPEEWSKMEEYMGMAKKLAPPK